MINNLDDGQDSFLDIVANLVGILIILVVVVGASASNRSQQTPIQPDPDLEAAYTKTIDQIENESYLTRKLRTDNQQLEQQIQEQNRLAAELATQRHHKLVQAETLRLQAEQIKAKIDAKLASFDEATQKKQQAQIQLTAAEETLTAELKDTEAQTVALAASFKPAKNKQLKHYPSPIAKTVFSEEIHFRLADGKLTYVPLEQLLGLMKDEWRLKAEQRLTHLNHTVETVGPLEGFRLQYQLTAVENGPASARQGRSITFDRFRVIPQPNQSSETVAEALSDGSRFRSILSRHEPRRTTVSIWLYPDGFSDHRTIKTWLHENGYQIASWPLKHGRHIAGGPNGFKTSAQ